ncbi:MAG: helicase-related protein [Acidobacteriota bacterium]
MPASSSDLTFITNEPGNTVRDRLAALLAHTTQFDVLVGYFFISGFHRIYKDLVSSEKVRILVGLKTDRATYTALQDAKQRELALMSHSETRDAVPQIILDELERGDDTPEIEDGIRTFVSWIQSGKLEVRAYREENLHAKVYIFSFVDGHIDKGRVVTGSSNLSQSGLVDQLEFNVELKNRSDYEYALAKFEELWLDAVEVSDTYADTIQRKSQYAEFTPYELYLKFLYEYFREELNRPDTLDDDYLPAGFKKLRYQEEAVLNAKRILEEYGGVFLADVVGLGKTYMSALLARELGDRVLVIAPPHLLDQTNPGSWRNVFDEFGVRGAKFESIGKLDQLAETDTSKYKYVFIDESHRFRTDSNPTYEKLATICHGKGVILVSATPLNNSLSDVLSQIKLFQKARASTIPNVRNLETFFANLQKQLAGLDRQHDREQYFKIMRENATAVREQVLKYLMVRRTRTEISRYYGEDLAAQGLRFPDVADPTPLFYHLDPYLEELFVRTVEQLTRAFSYARYNPLGAQYYRGDVREQERQGGVNLARFMKVLLIKRLESSFHAFRLTLDRFLRSHRNFIEQAENGHVFISKKHIHKVFDYLEEGDDESVEALLDEGKAERLPISDFRPAFLRDLRADYQALADLADAWRAVEEDPKWEAFKERLESDPTLRDAKILVFTESQETARYLGERIERDLRDRVRVFTGDASPEDKRLIIANFDARAEKPRDDFRILVATDVLAEGVSLHRASAVMNYDLPWNPTRLMQRVGRINRVDTTFEKIYTYNFFPSSTGNDVIKLRESAEAKIQAFIEMLGADARLLTEGEEVKSHDLFSRANSRRAITGEDADEESELEYLAEIRKLRDERPDEFERIKRLPRKARSTRDADAVDRSVSGAPPALLTYFRRGKLDKFFLAGGDASREVDFLSAVRVLRPADHNERRFRVGLEFYELLAKNQEGFASATREDEEVRSGPKGSTRSNENYVLQRLRAKEMRRFQGFTDDDDEFIAMVTTLLEEGTLPKATAKALKTAIETETQPLRVVHALRREIPKEYFARGIDHGANPQRAKREVILSSLVTQHG